MISRAVVFSMHAGCDHALTLVVLMVQPDHALTHAIPVVRQRTAQAKACGSLKRIPQKLVGHFVMEHDLAGFDAGAEFLGATVGGALLDFREFPV